MPTTTLAPDASRVLLGYGNTVDYEVVWSDAVVSDLMRHHRIGSEAATGAGTDVGMIATADDLLRSLLGHVVTGSGGEHFVASAQVLAEVAAHFPVRVTVGGTNVRAALAMRALGRPATVHLVSTGDVTRQQLPDDVVTISSAASDSLDPHVIVQFPAGAVIDLGGSTVVAPRANRVIYVNDLPNRELVVAEEFGAAVARADVVLVSGFNSIQDRAVLEARLADTRRHLARRRPGALAVYEHGAFHVPEFAELVCRELGPVVDVWSCNEDELQSQVGHAVDLLSPSEVLRAVRATRDAVAAPTLVVHTRHWALAAGGDAILRRAMVQGGIDLAAARFAFGDLVDAGHLAALGGWARQAEGAALAAGVEREGGDDLSCVGAYVVPTDHPTTVGLGDAFAGGMVAALADCLATA